MEDARFFFMSRQVPRRRPPSPSIQTILQIHKNEALYTRRGRWSRNSEDSQFIVTEMPSVSLELSRYTTSSVVVT